MFRKFIALQLFACFVVFGLAGSAQEQKKRSGTIVGELKARKNTKDNKNTIIDVLAPGEEKARAYYVLHDAKIKGPNPSVLSAVRAAKIGSIVELEWVETGHGPAIQSFKVFKKKTDKASPAGQYLEITYPASSKPGELQLGVTYTLWIPDGVAKIRGIIVHQHGCGSGACKGGATAAYDLHWQALAKKWDCALLGPSYHQEDKQNCRLWCDPRNGSHKTFLKCLAEFAAKSKHPEIEAAPWCLWGHSGGGFWASLMQTMYPERIVAIWFRSGTAYSAWEKGDIARPDIPAAAYAIPMMCNPGAKEKGDKRFNGAWTGSMAIFQAYRAKGAPAGFAPDPRTAHECGDSRYLAIPFFDACLAMRLPGKDGHTQKLHPVDMKSAWLATLLSEKAEPIASYAGNVKEATWLPNEQVAKAWMEYVKTGAVSDTTPPPAPINVKALARPDNTVDISWDAEADFESGIRGFLILRDGKELGHWPLKAVGRFGRPLFQSMSYHDTPEAPLPEMRFVDLLPTPNAAHEYRVIAVNSVGLQSPPAATRLRR